VKEFVFVLSKVMQKNSFTLLKRRLTLKKKKNIIATLHQFYYRVMKMEVAKKQENDFDIKFKLTNEQFQQLVQAKLDRMPRYRQPVEKDDFHDLL
jgi:hypothetical protein